VQKGNNGRPAHADGCDNYCRATGHPRLQYLQAADISAGSGVVIGTHGEILTNSHVVEDCAKITVQFKDSEIAGVVTRDQKNDLAVVRTGKPTRSVAAFRDGAPVRAGDAVVALGYPLSGLLASTANLSVGHVSALAGLGDDSRYLQISAPVQPGNSGGPLIDSSGQLVGIVTAKLNAARVARFTGDIPQNVNFALKAEVARTFLDSIGIVYQTLRSKQQLSPADVGDIARPFTVQIKCQKAASRSAAANAPQQAQRRASIREGQWDDEDKRRAYAAQVQALENGRSGVAVAWKNPDSGRYGSIVPGAAYQSNGLPCRPYTHTIYIDGTTQVVRGNACRNPDANWIAVGEVAVQQY
jgi:S1-C subfamily serine protease